MTNRRVEETKNKSHHQRISLLEDAARDVAVFSLGATTIAPANGNDTTWFTTAVNPACQCVMTGPDENWADQTFATLGTNGTVNTMSLKPGRYKVTLNVTVQNDHATAAMDYRFALTDDESTEVAFYNSNTVNISLPASSQNFSRNFNKVIFLDLTDDENVISYAHGYDAASGQTMSLVRGVSGQIVVERLG